MIILPFVFWGMGDVFRGGNQNVIATIDSKKVSTQEFMNYLNRLNLNEEQIKSLPRTDLIEKTLAQFIGRKVIVPIVNKEIPVIADDYADPNKGSGAVKITPAHDFNDFIIGKKHNLNFINIFDTEAKLNNNVPELEFPTSVRLDVRFARI